MMNADGTLAKDRLTSFIPLHLSTGPATVQVVLADGDARNIAQAPDGELGIVAHALAAQLIDQIRENVRKHDSEAGS